MNLPAFGAYMRQRFPPVNMALFAILFGTVYSVAAALQAGPAAQRAWGWPDWLGVTATISFFFRLRVFDEIKDYATDLEHHPERVLQQGRVTLGQLQAVAAVGTLLEVAWSVSMGWRAVLGWALAVGYSLLMRYEFFVPNYLRPRLVLYALTHILVMPLLIGWLWAAYAAPPLLAPPLGLLALLSVFGGLAFEIARKIRVPANERPGLDSYSRALGYGGAVAAVLVVLLAGVLTQGVLLQRLEARAWPFWLVAALYAATAAAYGWSLRRPSARTLKLAELLTSLFMLSSYVSIIAEIARRW
ncbi:UbiA prenyltransferase family protein [Hymenobacter guriensis]|uniref:Prenyltransferase n=1 Tax=Hymenobacter guriensis TaxID=2793065 RepID=A0ABS0L8C0_9BACT|nr:hypothetical protein [Hymenobacter guriensis]MBG8555644.1 hypothetical protein [Hymenobacter guriensis]